ncbi:MAG: ribonuclease Y [bacterium]|nr:ribonuclease Y [bacterium]
MQIAWNFVAIALLVGLVVGFLIRVIYAKSKVNTAENEAKKIVADAKRLAEAEKKEGLLQIKDEMYRARTEFERETHERRQELQRLERRLIQKEENLDHKLELIDKRERESVNRERQVQVKEKSLQDEEAKLAHLAQEQKQVLERISGLSADAAKKLLIDSMQEEAKRDAAILMRNIEEEAKETASKKSREVLAQAIQRYAPEFTIETTIATVALPNDEMKGRVIGREGRNIRAFEAATGVDLIIDDTPEAITLSSFDGVRREISRIALQKLISDGRIHPARIEEEVNKAKQEMDQTIKETGEEACFELGIANAHPEMIKLLGRLKFRTSYGQNVLQHSKEVAYIAGIMAAELGVDVTQAKRAGLFHDIGKSVDHEVEGTHATIGVDLARKYGESAKVLDAILSHHGDSQAASVEAVLVAAADAVSASRPGARRETLENYIKRLEKLETLAESFKGVEKCYAIQAGREVRVMVDAENIDDIQAAQLARDIVKKIEKELEYPGQIKVTLIREMRVVETAK